MKKHLPFIIASVLCLPFCLFVVTDLVGVALECVRVVVVTDVIEFVLNRGFLWLSFRQQLVLPVLILVSISVVAAWFQKGKTRLEMILTALYSVVIVLHIWVALLFRVAPLTLYE